MSESSATEFQAPPAEVLEPLFPHYEILNLIACGGMGAVYRARQASLDRIVAIKILPPELGGDIDYAKRFQEEARLMANLSNPHIVTVFDFGMAGSYLYFVMEYVDGKTLHDILAENGPMKYEACLRTMAEVCRGLDYAHEKGLVHLDIKPGNIMINREGEARVLDFGLAKILDPRKGSATETMGTPDYAAPERMIDGMKVDHRADIYSLGIMMYELLTGKVPRGTFTPASKVAGLDPMVDLVISRCTKQNPSDRYPKAREIFGDLVRLRRNAATWKKKKAAGAVSVAGGSAGAPKAPSEAVAAYQQMMAGKGSGSRGLVGWVSGLVAIVAIAVVLFLSGVFDDGENKRGKKRNGGGGGTVAESNPGREKPPRDRPDRPERPVFPDPIDDPDEPDGTGPDGPEVPPPDEPGKERFPFPPDGLAEEIAAVKVAMDERKPLEDLALEHLKIHGGRAYYMIPRRLSWREAEAFADGHGGHLATLTSEEEEQFVRETWFESASEKRGSRPVWIGGTHAESGWVWVSGEDWKYEGWGDKAPTVAPGDPPQAIVVHEVSWLVRPEDTPYSALVEWDPPKEVAATEPEKPDLPKPPTRPLTPLEKLRKGFEDRVRSDVVEYRETELAELGAKYLGALEGLWQRSSSMPVWEAQAAAEIARFKAQRTPPEAAEDSWPELGRLQTVLITESKRIDETARERRLQLIRTYGDALLAVQADFTSKAQWDEVAQAKEERQRIEGLKTEIGFATVIAIPKGLEELTVLVESDKSARFVSATPDGERFLVSGYDGNFRVFSSDAGEQEIEWEAGHAMGRIAFLPGGERFIALGPDGLFEIWDLGQRMAVFSEKEEAGSPVRLAVNPVGDACVVGLTTFKTPADPNVPGAVGVRPWALSDPPVKGEFSNKVAGGWTAFSPDGRHLALSVRKGLSLVVYGETEPLWENTDCKGEALVFSPDGNTIICGRILVDAANGETLIDLRRSEPERFLDDAEAKNAAVSAIAQDGDGIHVVFGLSGGGLEIWNIVEPKRIHEIQDAHAGVVTGVVLSKGGERMATSDVSGEVKLWNVLR